MLRQKPLHIGGLIGGRNLVQGGLTWGLSAFATVLNEHYGQAVTEMDLLKVMDIGDNKSSFEDMQQGRCRPD